MKEFSKVGLFSLISGLTALVYEVIWAKQLGLVFGTTAYAISTVLAIFFLGLALGSYWLGKLVDRMGKPLRLYGLMEALIGCYAFLTPWLFKLLEKGQTLIGSGWNFTEKSIARLILSLFILITPTILMGGTIPALIKYGSRLKSFGQTTAKFYGLNTLGAVLGACLAGFWLLPKIGIRSSISLAASINLAVGLGAIYLATKIKTTKINLKAWIKGENKGKSNRVVLCGIFLSGLASIGLEVLWTRVLILVIGISTYAFSLILAAFLLGIGLGSLIIKKWIDKIKPLKTFILLELSKGILVVLLIPLLGGSSKLYFLLMQKLGWSFFSGMTVGVLVSLFILLLPTTLMGMSLPIAVKIVAEKYSSLGEAVGKVYLFNTLGGVMGSLITGFWLISKIGMQKGMLLMAGIYFLVAIVLSKQKQVMAISALILILGLIWPDWSKGLLTSGVYINNDIAAPLGVFEKYYKERKLIYYKEGISSLIGVTLEPKQMSLLVNGKAQSSSTYDIKPQLMLGHLPMLLQNNPNKRALVIGLGTGMTLGAIEQHDDLEDVVAVEIEPEMVEAASYFDDVNDHALADPRLEIVIEDARNYLLTSDKKFEVISSQPSNPWIKGMANLSTVEFFELAKEHLTDDGIMIQWMQLDALSKEDLIGFIATFQSVFPEVSIWETLDSLFLVGSNEKINMQEKLGLPVNQKVKNSLLRMEVNSPAELLSHYVTDGERVKELVNGAKLQWDDLPFLEYNSPRDNYNFEQVLLENLKLIDKLRGEGGLIRSGDGYKFRSLLIKAQIELLQKNSSKAKVYLNQADQIKSRMKTESK